MTLRTLHLTETEARALRSLLDVSLSTDDVIPEDSVPALTRVLKKIDQSASSTRTERFSLEIRDGLNNRSYLTVVPGERVSLASSSQVPLALSNITGKNAWMLEHELLNVKSTRAALEVAHRYVYSNHVVSEVAP